MSESLLVMVYVHLPPPLYEFGKLGLTRYVLFRDVEVPQAFVSEKRKQTTLYSFYRSLLKNEFKQKCVLLIAVILKENDFLALKFQEI